MSHGSNNVQLPSIEVSGKHVPVSNIYPPYYPEEKQKWEAAPDPNDTVAYDSWGRKHFGKEWERRRKRMLKERNIYAHSDARYYKRQAELRQIENAVEGRSFPGGMQGDVWRGVWKEMRTSQAYVSRPNARDGEGKLARELQELQDLCKELQWSEETFAFKVCLLKTNLVNKERNKYEDRIGDEKLCEEKRQVEAGRAALKETPVPRNTVAYARLSDAFTLKSSRLENLLDGHSEADADAMYARNEEAMKKKNKAHDMLLRERPKTQDQLDKKLAVWQRYGLTTDEQEHLARFYGFAPAPRPDDTLPSESTPVSRPQPTKEELVSLVDTWRRGLILNDVEINALVDKYTAAQDASSPRSPHRDTPWVSRVFAVSSVTLAITRFLRLKNNA